MTLKEMRKAQNLTLTDVAKALRVSHVTVMNWEAGVAPKANYLTKLASILRCSVEDILRLYR